MTHFYEREFSISKTNIPPGQQTTERLSWKQFLIIFSVIFIFISIVLSRMVSSPHSKIWQHFKSSGHQLEKLSFESKANKNVRLYVVFCLIFFYYYAYLGELSIF